MEMCDKFLIENEIMKLIEEESKNEITFVRRGPSSSQANGMILLAIPLTTRVYYA